MPLGSHWLVPGAHCTHSGPFVGSFTQTDVDPVQSVYDSLAQASHVMTDGLPVDGSVPQVVVLGVQAGEVPLHCPDVGQQPFKLLQSIDWSVLPLQV